MYSLKAELYLAGSRSQRDLKPERNEAGGPSLLWSGKGHTTRDLKTAVVV